MWVSTTHRAFQAFRGKNGTITDDSKGGFSMATTKKSAHRPPAKSTKKPVAMVWIDHKPASKKSSKKS
jgi:hypothetical protein